MAVAATGTLTSTANPANADTVTIGGKVYTFQTTLTDVDGNVDIGTDAATSLTQLQNAINLGPGAGTQYATAMTEHAHVRATSTTATTLVATAKVAGSQGNLIGTTEASTALSWGAATLAGGTGTAYTDLKSILSGQQVNAHVAQLITDLTNPQGDA